MRLSNNIPMALSSRIPMGFSNSMPITVSLQFTSYALLPSRSYQLPMDFRIAFLWASTSIPFHIWFLSSFLSFSFSNLVISVISGIDCWSCYGPNACISSIKSLRNSKYKKIRPSLSLSICLSFVYNKYDRKKDGEIICKWRQMKGKGREYSIHIC